MIDLNQNPGLLVDALRSNIDENFSAFIRRTLDELENINAMSERKGYWLAKLENNKPSFCQKSIDTRVLILIFRLKKLKLN